tara:strand:+ start:89 stop:334 length:246 start_codon:yes stop_codon:yes gene_type:complete
MSFLSDLAVAGYTAPQIAAINGVIIEPTVNNWADLVAAGFSTAQALQIQADNTPNDSGNGFVQQGLWAGTQVPTLVAYLND